MRDETKPLPFVRAVRAVFDLSLEGTVWSGRTFLLALSLGLPLAFAVVYRIVLVSPSPPRITGIDLYGLWIVSYYYVRYVLPLAALFSATSLIADEVEGKTITYLLTRPIRRSAILVGKFASYLVAILTFVLPSTVAAFFLLATDRGWSGLGSRVPDLFRDLGVLVLTVAVYGAIFALLGVLLRRPVIPGLLFLFGWELLALLPGYMPRFTVTAYLRSMLPYRLPEGDWAATLGEVLPFALCLEVLGAVLLVSLAGAVWIFSTREYVLEQ